MQRATVESSIHTVIKRKYHSMLIIGVCYLPHPHVAHTLQDIVQSLCCKMFDHLLYSLDLSLCEFHMLSPLKSSGKVLIFWFEISIKNAVVRWF